MQVSASRESSKLPKFDSQGAKNRGRIKNTRVNPRKGVPMLNLRCLYCQTPFTVGRSEMLTALITMDEKNQNHHDAHCPRCRRANSISRQRMELFFPNWREAAKQVASAPTESAAASAALKTEPLPKSVRSAAVKTAATKKTAADAKPSAPKRQRSSKPAAAKKTTPSAKVTTPKPSKAPKSAPTPKTKKK